jgi:hypothetical protein
MAAGGARATGASSSVWRWRRSWPSSLTGDGGGRRMGAKRNRMIMAKFREQEARRKAKEAELAAGPPRKPPGCTPAQHRQIAAGIAVVTEIRVGAPTRYPVQPPLDKATFHRLLRGLGFDSYAAYLWSPLWLEIRRRVFERARKRCEDCGRRASQVHHLVYTLQNLSGESLEGLLALCDACHGGRHGETSAGRPPIT